MIFIDDYVMFIVSILDILCIQRRGFYFLFREYGRIWDEEVVYKVMEFNLKLDKDKGREKLGKC